MRSRQWIEEIRQNIVDVISFGNKANLERNMRASLTQAFHQLDLVTRDEFDVQFALLERALNKVELLKSQIQELKEEISALERQ